MRRVRRVAGIGFEVAAPCVGHARVLRGRERVRSASSRPLTLALSRR